MYYIYILKLSDGRYYIGQTKDIAARVIRHQRGYSKFTKPYRPVELLLSKSFSDRSSAMAEEKRIKSQKSARYIEEYIKANGGPIV